MLIRWYWRIASLLIAMAVMFPVYLLWLDMNPSKAVARSLMVGVGSLMGVISAQKAEAESANKCGGGWWDNMNMAVKIGLVACCLIVLGGIYVACIGSEKGVAIIVDVTVFLSGIVSAVIYNLSRRLNRC